jgi:ribonuclease HI
MQKSYTDGSCHEGDNPDVARAGWGAYFAKNSKHNFAAPLDGPVQTSYRAELKAVIHVIRKTATPTVIMCDCQSVVKTFDKYQDCGIPSQGLREQDLWDQVFMLMKDTAADSILMQWMPGHLDDKAKADKKAKMLKDGTI